jgi:hypothetical protein
VRTAPKGTAVRSASLFGNHFGIDKAIPGRHGTSAPDRALLAPPSEIAHQYPPSARSFGIMRSTGPMARLDCNFALSPL